MRAFFLFSFSAVVLSGCLTTQANPNYEQTTSYRNAPAATQQYASAPVTQATHTTTYSSEAYSQETFPQETYTGDMTQAGYETTPSYPVFAHSAPSQSSTMVEAAEAAPTDLAYSSDDITGTPGFMAMQSENEALAASSQTASLPSVQTASSAAFGTTTSYGAAGTPIAYDYSRNLVTADALTTGQQPDEIIRLMPGAGQGYTVQPGDTVYSLARKTCVGVNVIQSMNGIGADYGIKIGQSLRLPASVC